MLSNLDLDITTGKDRGFAPKACAREQGYTAITALIYVHAAGAKDEYALMLWSSNDNPLPFSPSPWLPVSPAPYLDNLFSL